MMTSNTRLWPNVWLMLGHRLRRRPSIKPALSRICWNVLPNPGAAADKRMLSEPANTIHSPNGGLMLVHSLRRRPNIKPTLGRCIVFAG